MAEKKICSLGGEMGNWIRSFCYDPTQNILWIGRFQNLTLLDVQKQILHRMLTQNNDAKTNTIKVIKLDGDSLIWFGTESGVFKYRKNMNMENRDAWELINNKDAHLNEGDDAYLLWIFLFEPAEYLVRTDEFITVKDPNFNVGGIYFTTGTRNGESYHLKTACPLTEFIALPERAIKYGAVFIHLIKEKRKIMDEVWC